MGATFVRQDAPDRPAWTLFPTRESDERMAPIEMAVPDALGFRYYTEDEISTEDDFARECYDSGMDDDEFCEYARSLCYVSTLQVEGPDFLKRIVRRWGWMLPEYEAAELRATQTW